MKFYGYKKGDFTSEMPMELKEACLELSLDEIDDMIEFLKFVKEKHSSVKETAIAPHTHYSFWKKQPNEINPDLIISTTFKKR